MLALFRVLRLLALLGLLSLLSLLNVPPGTIWKMRLPDGFICRDATASENQIEVGQTLAYLYCGTGERDPPEVRSETRGR